MNKQSLCDMHSHILPYVDHGAKDLSVSQNLLQKASDIGCTAVAMTPHFYKHRTDVDTFLQKRNVAMADLKNNLSEVFPKMNFVLGAEVALESDLLEELDGDALRSLCYENTDYLLLEMPTTQWRAGLVESIYDVMSFGITPVIAHIDRYNDKQIDEVLEIDPIVQVNADAFCDFFKKRKMMKLYEKGKIHLIGSDAHDLDVRNYDTFIKASTKLSDEMLKYFYDNSINLLNNKKL